MLKVFVVGTAMATLLGIDAAAAAAQPSGATVSVRGVVVRASDGAPVAGAEVWAISGDQRTQSDSAGSFRLDNLSPGRLLIQIRRVGYDVRRDTFTVAGAVDSTYRFELVQLGTQLDTVHTVAGAQRFLSPALRAFEERRATAHGGYFISDSVLRRNENTSLLNLITARMPGLRVGTGRALVSSRKQCKGLVLYHASDEDKRCAAGGAPNCYVSIFIDGALRFSSRIADQGARPFDLSHETVADFSGIEFYSDQGTAPAGMHTDDEGCGSIWLWTRER